MPYDYFNRNNSHKIIFLLIIQFFTLIVGNKFPRLSDDRTVVGDMIAGGPMGQNLLCPLRYSVSLKHSYP